MRAGYEEYEIAPMIVLPHDASDQAILALVERWVDALAARDYDGAAAMLTRDGNERDGRRAW
jgi:hypothetical protein